MPVSTAVNSDTFKVSTPADREIELSRLFDAPRHLVWEAMTKPEHIKRWWGNLGEGYSVPVCEVDLRVGGTWRFSNQMPSGDLATFYGVYQEIAPPDRIVFTEIFEPYPDAPSTVTAVFTEENGKTRMTVTAEYVSKDVRDMVIASGMARGAGLSYDALEAVAAELASKQ
ncbi:MAG TPA: SRPBCC family protein [Thermoanaerobaculia bacterium]